MSRSTNRSTMPRAMIHKRILDVADDQPEASMETVASEVPSATTDLVERVLDEYGDPVEETAPLEADERDDETESHYPDADELTTKQLETVIAIYEHPNATQRELAEILNVAGATVCNRMKGVERFEWEERQVFAEAVIDSEETLREVDSTLMTTNQKEQEIQFDQLIQRISSLEEQVEDLLEPEQAVLSIEHPELVHKILHACLESENITEEEEIKILKEIL